MKTQLFQIYDRTAEQVVGPIIAANRAAAATRNFQEVIKDERTELAKHPMDYELRHIGEQNTDDGSITPVRVTTIYTGAEWIREQARPASSSVVNATDELPGLMGQNGADTIITR